MSKTENLINRTTKHIFYTHSHITSLCVKCIINEYNIPQNNILIICLGNHYKVLNKKWFEGIDVHVYSRAKWERRWFKGRIGSYLKDWSIHLYIKKLVKSNDYLFYTPHDYREISKFLIFNKKCKGYFYIEEGLGSYNARLFQKHQVANSLMLNYLKPTASRFSDRSTYNLYPNLLGGICFNQGAFPTINEKIILNNLYNSISIEANDIAAPYLIFDDMVNMKICTLENLLKTLLSYLAWADIKAINIKFHYRQNHIERKAILNYLSVNNIHFNIINDSRVMELYFINREFDVIGYLSSLLFYHKLFGKGKTISLVKELFKEDENNFLSKNNYLINLFYNNKINFYSSRSA